MSIKPTNPTRLPPPTRDDVIHLAGDVDDDVVTAILGTGATYVEVEEAVKWALGNAEELPKQARRLSPAAEAVYGILASDPAFLGDDSER